MKTPRASGLIEPSSRNAGPCPRNTVTSCACTSLAPNEKVPRISTKSPSLIVPEPENCRHGPAHREKAAELDPPGPEELQERPRHRRDLGRREADVDRPAADLHGLVD